MDNFKKVSCYDDKGGFIGHSTAPKDERGDGYLKPANSTFTIAPGVVFPEMAWLNIEKDVWHILTIEQKKPTELTIEQRRAGMIISNAQARLKLIKLGLFDAIDKAILSMPRNEPIYILWEYGTNFHRTDEHLIAFCTDTLKMTAEDIDALFM